MLALVTTEPLSTRLRRAVIGDRPAQLAGLLAAGAVGGTVAWVLSLPLPFMLGGLITSIGLVARATAKGREVGFPRLLRMAFVGMIGAMIGGAFTPEVVALASGLGLSLAGVTAYVLTAHGLGYVICRRVGRYDRVTSFYAAMPGGLIEAIALGERGGGDVKVLTLSHFLRVLTVVTALPFFFLIWSGEAVGSAAGQSFERGPTGLDDVGLLIALTVTGLILAKSLRAPAGHLLGPMLLSAAGHGTGLISVSSPEWLLFVAQLFVGVGLGAQFSGATRALMFKVARVSAVMIAAYLMLSAALATALTGLTPLTFEALLLSLAPGGVSEMGLIALSLSISPLIVAAHHVYRIFLTVFIAAVSTRFIERR